MPRPGSPLGAYPDVGRTDGPLAEDLAGRRGDGGRAGHRRRDELCGSGCGRLPLEVVLVGGHDTTAFRGRWLGSRA